MLYKVVITKTYVVHVVCVLNVPLYKVVITKTYVVHVVCVLNVPSHSDHILHVQPMS
jgi:hypothetical protein